MNVSAGSSEKGAASMRPYNCGKEESANKPARIRMQRHAGGEVQTPA
jgi:hypothetical protein